MRSLRRCLINGHLLNWYVSEGMEEGEFYEAKDDLLSLVKDYDDIAAGDENPIENPEA